MQSSDQMEKIIAISLFQRDIPFPILGAGLGHHIREGGAQQERDFRARQKVPRWGSRLWRLAYRKEGI
jgi:hypothetical protein